MTRVWSSSVTSVRKARSSTRPTRSTDSWDETGKSGLVICDGWENVGRHRSTRAESGATSRSPVSGCGMGVHAAAAEVAAPDDEADDAPNAPPAARLLTDTMPARVIANLVVFMTASIGVLP